MSSISAQQNLGSVGRNDPCPCGSGLKFKKCCLNRRSAPSSGPAVVLVEEKGSDRWKIELRDFKAFQTALGADVLREFSRCFVHADRLTSLISFAYVSGEHHGHDSIAFGRNLQAMVWFTVGTLSRTGRRDS